jgi:hypothetical protein
MFHVLVSHIRIAAHIPIAKKQSKQDRTLLQAHIRQKPPHYEHLFKKADLRMQPSTSSQALAGLLRPVICRSSLAKSMLFST